jgi:hypothetical protein
MILPATFFVWVGGWLVSGACTPREFLRLKFHATGYQRNLYGPAHLWSLEYLAVLLGVYWIVLIVTSHLGRRFLAAAARCGDGIGRLLQSGWRPVLLAVPTTLILWAGHRAIGLDAIMDRQNSFVPEPYRLLHNALFFVVGVVLHRSVDRLSGLATFPLVYLGLSVPVFAARAWLIHGDLESPLGGASAWALAATGSLFTWLITFGFLGLALSVLNRPWSAVRYVADSSYWVYLIHLPIVGVLQVNLFAVQAPAVAKFAIVLAVSMGLGLASYQTMVRHTILGVWLHGRRERPRGGFRWKLQRHLRPARSVLSERPTG